MSPDPNLVACLERHGQGHLLAWWNELTDAQRVRLQAEIAAIDFDQLRGLIDELVRGNPRRRSNPSASSRSR